VSSKEQENEGYSLDAQEKLGRDYAQRMGFKIDRDWKVSESAWKMERKAFNQMIEYAQRHEAVGHIIFDITDRMTRNDFDKLKIYTLIKEHGKTIHFSRTGKIYDKNSGPDEEFMFDIEVAVAKKMSNDISRKTKMGMEEKAEQGFYPSIAPLGYLNNKLTRLMEVDPEAAPYVKRAFSLMATGDYSLNMLVDNLYREGFRSKKDYGVQKSTIAQMLKNPIYYGAFKWKGKMYEGNHEPLITKSEFDTVQDVLAGKTHPAKHIPIFHFNNLVTCGECYCKVIGERKKGKYTYYHCTFSKGRHQGVTYFREEQLAGMFEKPVQRVTIDQGKADWILEALHQDDKKAATTQEKRMEILQKEHDRAKARLSKLYDCKFDGDIDDDVFALKEEEYKRLLIDIKSQMDRAKIVNPNYIDDARRILELSKRLHSLYLKADYDEKAEIAKLIASNYTLTEQSLCPTYRKPFVFLDKGLYRTSWLRT
jgi:DNA invertase Pin-like site-specific DNA recombinase